ncbi:MAG: NADH-quinone oxidoreductase subunit M [Planctomycetota bacterium]
MDTMLLLLILIPLVGAAAGALMPGGLSRYWALGTSLTVALVAALLGVNFDWQAAAPTVFDSLQFESQFFNLDRFNFGITLGVDSIAMWLVLLTALLMPLAVLASYAPIKTKESSYYAWMLLLLAAMMGVFVARDVLLFYIFFELTLIPMFFLIGVWGGANRREAAVKFFLFTFVGSVFTLAAILFLAAEARTFEMTQVIYTAQQLSPDAQFWVMLGLLAGFAVKIPLFPVHTWLPLAHTEAPTAGSVLLAGVLLKLGTYGMLRLAVPAGLVSADGVPAFATGLIQFLGVLCLIGIIYGALVAWVQQDIKKLVAYSSVSHLGFCVLGLLAFNAIGIQGSVFYMLNHGISTGAMFLVIGMIYDRYHTRDIDALSGLGAVMPKLAFFFVLFVMASIGLPGTNGFISEFLSILGAFVSDQLGIWFGIIAAIGVILGAVYMLHMTAKIIFGPLKRPHRDEELPEDLNLREFAILAPLAVIVIVFGVLPKPLLDSIRDEALLAINPIELPGGEPSLPEPGRLDSPSPEPAVPETSTTKVVRVDEVHALPLASGFHAEGLR